MRSANFVVRIAILVKDGYQVSFRPGIIQCNIHCRIQSSTKVYLGLGKTLEEALTSALRDKEIDNET